MGEYEKEAGPELPPETDEWSLNLENEASGQLLSEFPEVSEHAIQAEMERQEHETKQLMDKDGNLFDASIHVTDANGQPVLNRDGTLRKKRGVKAGSSKISSGIDNQPENREDVDSRAAGKVAANLLITLGCTIGGDEWQPRKIEEYGLDEQLQLESAFGDYFEATGRKDFPPGIALAIVVGGYAIPRFRAPVTKSKFKRVMEWGYMKWYNFRNGKVYTPPKDKNQENDQKGE